MSKRLVYSKICEYCHLPFEAKSNYAKYCSDGHRVMAYKIRNNIPLPDFAIKEMTQRVPTKTEIAITEKTALLDGLVKKIQTYKREEELYLKSRTEPLKSELDSVISKNTNLEMWFKPPTESAYNTKLQNILIDYYRDLGFYDKHQNYSRYSSIYNFFDKNELNEVLQNARLYAISKFQLLMEEVIKDYHKLANMDELVSQSEVLKEEINMLYQRRNASLFEESGKLVNTDEIRKKEFDVYELSEGFENVFGKPEKVFTSMIHGDSGSGKSSFAVKFASYFSKYFGKTCYLPLEEGVSLTFQSKLDKYAVYGDFDVAIERVPSKIQELSQHYKLIIIDSISYQEFNKADINVITQYKRSSNTSFLFVVHNNKTGQYAGSSHLSFDFDINLTAVKGLITSHSKSRFMVDDLENYSYRIFRPRDSTD